MSDKIRLQQVARGERPRYFDDPAIDKVLSITLALAGEVAVLHDRLDSALRLLESQRVISRPAIESFETTPEIRAERDAWRDKFLEIVLRSIQQELEALQLNQDQPPYAAVIDQVENH
jgi:hypothetical protein